MHGLRTVHFWDIESFFHSFRCRILYDGGVPMVDIKVVRVVTDKPTCLHILRHNVFSQS